MKINIFTPTYHRFEMTKRCLESIIPSVMNSVYDTTLFICDNNSPKEMQEWLRTLCGDKVKLFVSDKNIGKAGIVNQVYGENNDCTHVISIDSDMIHDEDSNWVDGMVWCIENFPKFGLLSTFQKENDQHLWGGLTKTIERDGHKVSFGKYNHVAGGCIILKKKVWDDVKGYSTFGGVYGFDDGLLMQHVRNKELFTGVINSVRLIHPFDQDKDYKNWKAENISKRQSEGFYENS